MQHKYTKWLALLACALCAIGFSACGGNNPPDTSGTPSSSSSYQTDSNGKTIPVYQGMTISAAAQTQTQTNARKKTPNLHPNDGMPNYGHYEGDICHGDKKPDIHNPFPDHSSDQTIETEIEDSLEVIGAEKDMYYAEIDQDIYIHIHIHNPDNFEILSFTLNGNKYSGYMFEQGSTMSTLILKYNVGATSGRADYTIDAIKYIDGTEIKDVLIDGNKTVSAGIRRENQVSASVSNETATLTSFSFHTTIRDDDGLIADSEGALKAVLYDGETLVAVKPLTIGENEVVFDNLKRNAAYQYAVVGYYDNFKDGFGMNMLYKNTFYTQEIVLFDSITVSYESIEFDYVWYAPFENKTFTSLKVYQGDNVVQTLDPSAKTATDLLTGTDYRLVAEYKNGETTERITLDFTTLAKSVPTLKITNVQKTNTSIEFELEEEDANNVGTITSIVLTNDTETIYAENTEQRSFSNLTIDLEKTYTLTVYYEYDLHDGNGVQNASVCAEIAAGSFGLKYESTNDGYAVTGIGTCTDTVLVIPSTYENLPVTSIGDSAFSGCSSLTSVTILDSVTSIGNYAFSGCSRLTSVTIGDSVTSIGEEVFYNCSGLTSITIPDSVMSIGNSAFSGCSGLMSVTIGDSVMSIGNSAFSGCSGLMSVTIGDSVMSIGNSAFSGCSGLTSVTIGDSVTKIGNYAFRGCAKLENIYITDIAAWCKINGLNGIMWYSSSNKKLYLNNQLVTDLILPDTVTSICNYAFYDYKRLTSITIPDSVTSIGGSAFSGCRRLTSITLPDSVTSIGDSAFSGCSGLTSVIIPDSVTKINYQTFHNCSGLTSVTIGDSVTEIGKSAFEACNGLISVIIGDSVTEIGMCAFQYCSGLTSIMIPDSVTKIGENAFCCSGLTSITIPDSVTSIGNSAFLDCSGLTSVTISDSVTSIGNRAFDGCGSLTSITIPNSVTSIGESAFSNCDSLTTVYYKGTADEWKNIDIDDYNSPLLNATRYYYSETQPTISGNYWHYDDKGNVAIWEN